MRASQGIAMSKRTRAPFAFDMKIESAWPSNNSQAICSGGNAGFMPFLIWNNYYILLSKLFILSSVGIGVALDFVAFLPIFCSSYHQ